MPVPQTVQLGGEVASFIERRVCECQRECACSSRHVRGLPEKKHRKKKRKMEEAAGAGEVPTTTTGEEELRQLIEEVTLEVNNGKESFVRISEEEMPEILKFMEERSNFSEWAVLGQGRKANDDGSAGAAPPTEEAESSLASSQFLRNFEEQMRMVRQEREEQWKNQGESSVLEPSNIEQNFGNPGWAVIPPTEEPLESETTEPPPNNNNVRIV